MMKRRKNSLRFEPDFTEDFVGYAINAFLATAAYPNRGCTIEPFTMNKERWLGADARVVSSVNGFYPFYLQFKRPSLYPSISTSKIVKDRKRLQPSLNIEPNTLFFDLRRKAPKHVQFQHNVLFALNRRLSKYLNGRAIYVCPRFMESNNYSNHMHLAAYSQNALNTRFAWSHANQIINSVAGPIGVGSIPLFREHVCFPPHASVTSASHSYSFTEFGTEICFHSPTYLPDLERNFADMLSDYLQESQYGENMIGNVDAFDTLHQVLQDELLADILPILNPEILKTEGINSWLILGDILERHFGIKQYAIVKWNENQATDA